MSDDVSGPPPKRAESTLLDNPIVYDLIISKIDEQVSKRLRERNRNFRNWIIGILTIIVAIIPAVGVTALQYMMDKAVTSAVEEGWDDIRFDSKVASLDIKVVKVDNSDSFTREEADMIIEEIDSLVSKSEENEQQLRKLEFAIGTAMKNFAAVDRLEFVLRLEDIIPDSLLNSGTVIQTILLVSAYRLLADPLAPDSWTTDPTGSRSENYSRYRAYANRAKFSGYPELDLLYEMLLSYVENGKVTEIDQLIRDADKLEEEDAENFVNTMTIFANGTMPKYPGKDRVVDRVIDFLCTYGEQGKILRRVKVSEQPVPQWIHKGGCIGSGQF